MLFIHCIVKSINFKTDRTNVERFLRVRESRKFFVCYLIINLLLKEDGSLDYRRKRKYFELIIHPIQNFYIQFMQTV